MDLVSGNGTRERALQTYRNDGGEEVLVAETPGREDGQRADDDGGEGCDERCGAEREGGEEEAPSRVAALFEVPLPELLGGGFGGAGRDRVEPDVGRRTGLGSSSSPPPAVS